MADYLVTDTELTDVADAIRTKGGTSAALEWPDGFVDAINAISGGGGGTVAYNSTNNVPSNVSVDKASAEEGETVTATLVSFPSGGHSYSATWQPSGSAVLFRVNAGKGSNVVGDVATFTMPAANVQISRTA